MLRVAVVGSGPAGLYTAEALVKQAALLPTPVTIQVDVLDRLPTPYGLVRYGVAPDHKSIKSVANYLRRVLESPGVTFVGGVHFGTDVTREDLLGAYDAVVYATGAMRDRRLGIPGEDLPGSRAATDFVNWYCGHPDVDAGAFTLDAESVAVIGVGNVAVDVARILARDPAELEQTDIPEPVMEALRDSKVREVHVIGRRGPAHAKFTTKELRELGDLPGVHVSADAAELDLADGFDRSGESAALATSDRRVRGNLVAMAGWGGAAADVGRRLRLRFWLRPAEIQESESRTVAGLRLERTRLSESGAFEGTGEFETLDAQLVLRSVGYQSVPLPGVPFDARTYTVRNVSGRVLSETGEPLPGEYVAGWLKRGPTGVIGTNKADAAETVQALLADLAGGPEVGEGKLPRPGLLRRPESDDLPEPDDPAGGAAVRSALAPVLVTRGVTPVSYADWLRISAAEEDLAASLGRGDRVKLPHRDAIWSAARPNSLRSAHVLRSALTVRKNDTTLRHDGVTARDHDGRFRAPAAACRPPTARRRGPEMLDASGTQHLLLAETLGLAMARRASDILERHRAALADDGPATGSVATGSDDDQFAVDNAVFTAILDAANECLGRFDTRPADDRWCDALLQVINLAQLAALAQRSDEPR